MSSSFLPPELAGRAQQSCRQCRRLKRKCPRDLPSCALCDRLGKKCQYPAGRKPYGSPQDEDEESQSQLSQVMSTPSAASVTSYGTSVVGTFGADFPSSFFLDSDLFQPISHDALGCPSSVPPYVSDLLHEDVGVICERYFNTVDTWFPFVSRKKLKQDLDSGIMAEVALLLVCMKLATEVPGNHHAAAVGSLTYEVARRYTNELEVTVPTSLRLFQATILVAVYEIGHGMLPTAYLTVAKAARLGLLRGVHDRGHTTQLFQTPPTWTHWEEERRAWWATSILERYMNLGPSGLPMATPEPVQGELLPALDSDWFRGAIGSSQPLYSKGFSSNSQIGPFARVCQASHVLGRVLRHRNSRKEAGVQYEILTEALQLEATSSALDAHLSQTSTDSASTVDLAISIIARLALYHGYACIQPDAVGERLPEETEMQGASIRGLKQIISDRGPRLASLVIRQATENIEGLSPLVVQALYDVATECQWFVREGDVADGADSTLRLATDALVLLSQRWKVGDKCLHLLGSTGGY
ncbi:fungal specific transcription factor [Colletotrichum musicola]|uniref:Fungal specific transcription factor n=1 Tax=Colletotrichum musicola TaxID=2175873 RepID=A0A8H6MWM8_9PEZI|nr:fungal specific transcription factor [Colletotrichum musicola]